VGSRLFSIGRSGAVLQRRFPAGGQARGGAVGHSFVAQGGMECCDRLRWRGSIKANVQPRPEIGMPRISHPLGDNRCILTIVNHAYGLMLVTEDLSPRRRMLILAICCTSLLIVEMDSTIVNVALPSLGRDLHAWRCQLVGR
jgi:hypothetical protein